MTDSAPAIPFEGYSRRRRPDVATDRSVAQAMQIQRGDAIKVLWFWPKREERFDLFYSPLVAASTASLTSYYLQLKIREAFKLSKTGTMIGAFVPTFFAFGISYAYNLYATENALFAEPAITCPICRDVSHSLVNCLVGVVLPIISTPFMMLYCRNSNISKFTYLSIELKQYQIPTIRGTGEIKEISRFVVPTVWRAVRTRAPLLALANLIACSITVYVQEKARLSMRYDMEENPALVREALQAAEGSSRIRIFNWISNQWSNLTRKSEE